MELTAFSRLTSIDRVSPDINHTESGLVTPFSEQTTEALQFAEKRKRGNHSKKEL
jgi:hypothetical protein